MSSSSPGFLSNSECQTLLRIARDSVERKILGKDEGDLSEYPLTGRLKERHGAFVTLRKGRELRGCIGYTRGVEPLAKTVRDNAINAASRDPRFPPVDAGELPKITIEISALHPGDEPESPFIQVNSIHEIEIGRDGLYLEHAGTKGGGLLLPQVAIEQGWDLQEFLRGVCRKAGAPERAWELPDSKLYRFSAQVFSENSSD